MGEARWPAEPTKDWTSMDGSSHLTIGHQLRGES